MIGYPLFSRTSRSVSLTVAGESFLEGARRTIRNLGRDVEQTRSVGRGEVGSLHIGFVGSGMIGALPGILRLYRETYPKVRLSLHESFTSRVMEGLENGTLDAGFLRDGDPAPGLRVEPILSEPFVAVLPSSHPRAKQKSLSPADLRGEPFVYFPRTAGARAFEKPFMLFEEYGFRPRIVQEASHWLTIMQLVGAGFGITVAPACVRRSATPGVVCLPFRKTQLRSTIELARRVGDMRPIVDEFARVVERAKA